jgi:hypothetical protein
MHQAAPSAPMESLTSRTHGHSRPVHTQTTRIMLAAVGNPTRDCPSPVFRLLHGHLARNKFTRSLYLLGEEEKNKGKVQSCVLSHQAVFEIMHASLAGSPCGQEKKGFDQNHKICFL